MRPEYLTVDISDRPIKFNCPPLIVPR